jgi:hypothetical protein
VEDEDDDDECPAGFVAPDPLSRIGLKPNYFSAAEDGLLRYIVGRRVGSTTRPWERVSAFMQKHTGVERSEYFCKARWSLISDPSFDAEEERSRVETQFAQCAGATGWKAMRPAGRAGQKRRDSFLDSPLYRMTSTYYSERGGLQAWQGPVQQRRRLNEPPPTPAPLFTPGSAQDFLSRSPSGPHRSTRPFKDTNIEIGSGDAGVLVRVPALGAASLHLEGPASSSSSNPLPLDLALNACAPVWCVAFNPSLATGAGGDSRYLAVGTTRLGWPDDAVVAAGVKAPPVVGGAAADPDLFGRFSTAVVEENELGCAGLGCDQLYVVGQGAISAARHPNIVQIWRLDGDGTAADTSAHCVFGIGVDECGPVWSLQWCPVRSSPTASGDNISDWRCHRGSELGLLAVVCGNGSCVVFAVPREQWVAGCSGCASADLDGLPVLLASSLRRWEIGAEHGVSCVAWHVLPRADASADSAGSGGDRYQLLCGQTNGSWSLWPVDFGAHPDSDSAAAGSCVVVPEPLRTFSDLQVCGLFV